jgi:hypothetical protein
LRLGRHPAVQRLARVLDEQKAFLLAEVEPLSGYDKEVYEIHFKGEYLDQWEEPASVIPTCGIDRVHLMFVALGPWDASSDPSGCRPRR